LDLRLEGIRLANRTMVGAQQSIVAATKEARQKLRHVDNSRKDEKASPDKCLRD